MSKQLVHGGDWAGFEEEYGFAPLDCSANVSPLGLPNGVRQAIVDALDQTERYPDPLCRSLCAAIGRHHGVPAAWCLCGNGAADVIIRVVQAVRPKRALLTAPTFSEYETALDAVGCQTEHWRLTDRTGFRLGEDFVSAITPETDMVFLCEPNNPTGVTSPRELLEAVCDRCQQTGTWLVLDECFQDFLEEPERHTMAHRLETMPRLVILKTFTKLYAMAGVRLGYCLSSNGELLEQMHGVGQPWTVSSLAQSAGIAALREKDYVRRVREIISAERRHMLDGLRELGLTVIDGEANYLLFRSREGLTEELRRKGILIRSCANYIGLDGHWYRTAVQGAEQNQQFLDTLKEVLA